MINEIIDTTNADANAKVIGEMDMAQPVSWRHEQR
jgi:hypothetical protein